MKKTFKIILIFFISIAAFGNIGAQNESAGIIKALKSADATQMAVYFDKMLDLKLPDKEEIKGIGKNQAGFALKSFFEENNITGFELTSQRELGGTMYITGRLIDEQKGYNLTLMTKNKSGKQQIITVRIN